MGPGLRRGDNAADHAKSFCMIPWVKIDTAHIPGTDAELRLMKRGAEFSIMLGTNELMNSRLSGSEAALATLAVKKLEANKKPHLLIGGLGMGFTLRAALAVLEAGARIVVAELVPAVVAWGRGPMAEIFGGSLNDTRVSIQEVDVTEIIRSSRSKFDAILLDVDNGPEGLTRKANDGLYSAAGLSAAHTALRPGGVLAVWSSGPNPPFSKRLRAAGFDVNEVAVRATGRGGGARHIIWIATKDK
jgi:spermidine synthase